MKKIIKQHPLYISAILTMALLANVIVPLYFPITTANAANNSEINELFGDKILICTASGYKYISLEDYNNGNLPSDYDPRIKCSICIVHTVIGNAFIPDITTVKFPLQAFTHYHYSISRLAYLSHKAARTIHPRAPPYFFSA